MICRLVVITTVLVVIGFPVLDWFPVKIGELLLATYVCDILTLVEIVKVGSLAIQTCFMRESAFIQNLLAFV